MMVTFSISVKLPLKEFLKSVYNSESYTQIKVSFSAIQCSSQVLYYLDFSLVLPMTSLKPLLYHLIA